MISRPGTLHITSEALWSTNDEKHYNPLYSISSDTKILQESYILKR